MPDDEGAPVPGAEDEMVVVGAAEDDVTARQTQSEHDCMSMTHTSQPGKAWLKAHK